MAYLTGLTKNLSVESAPYRPYSRITFEFPGGVYDLPNMTIQIPMTINQEYPGPLRGGSYNGCVSNVALSNSPAVTLAEVNFNDIRLEADGRVLYSCDRINILGANIDVYRYNSPQEKLQEYFGGSVQQLPDGLAKEAEVGVSYSAFRQLFNIGTELSKALKNYLQVPLHKILPSLSDEPRDFSKFSKLTLSFLLEQLQDQYLEPTEIISEFAMGNPTPFDGATNTIPWGVSIAGNWTSTSVFVTTATYQGGFPFAVGDSVNFTTAGNGRAITALAGGTGGTAVTLTFAAAPGAVGADTILANSVGVVRQVMVTGQTIAALAEAKFEEGSAVCIYDDNNLPISPVSTSILALFQSGGDILVLLSTPLITLLGGGGGSLAFAPLYLSYTGTPGNGNPIPDNQPTTLDYSISTLSAFVGMPVVVSAYQNCSPMSTKISSIRYAGGKAELSFSPAITADGAGAIANLVVTAQPVDSLKIEYPEKCVLQMYTLPKMKGVQYEDIYSKFSMSALSFGQVSLGGTLQNNFTLPPMTDFIVLCLPPSDALVSDIGELASYQLYVDDQPTTTEPVKLSGDDTFKYERLLSGFLRMGDDINAIDVRRSVNKMSPNEQAYVILQDVVPLPRGRVLKVMLKNGNASVYDARTMYCYARSIDRL